MPLDHYVPQVHLRKFYSPALGNRMYAIRKSNLKAFTPDSRSVCRIMDGSTNAYLRKDRPIEEFLRAIEPNYTDALGRLAGGEIDNKCVHTIAGFVAYVIGCSPAGMRIHSAPLRSIVETTAATLEAQGVLPLPPAELGGASLTELLRDGTVEVTIDRKYPQAISIASILRIVALFGNFAWEILQGDSDKNSFLTSDFPVAIEATDDPRILNRIIPLAPHLALRIRPDPTIDRSRSNLSFASFRYRRRNLAHDEIMRLNRLIVRCAEDVVFYRDDDSWVHSLVSKNRHYRIEPQTSRLRTPAGILLVWTQRVIAGAPPRRPTRRRAQ